jgi:glycerophosphoryl diester phosphodiesterase
VGHNGVVKIIAHRGASGYHPEQTRDAYETAVDQRADGVECDIRLTADGHLVCIHDATVDRVTDGTGQVNHMTLAQLRELDAGRPGRPQSLLTLPELLTLVADAQTPDHRPELFVETKRLATRGERDGRLEAALDRDLTDSGIDRTLVHLISFDAGSLARFRRIDPTLHRVYLRKEYPLWRQIRHLEPAGVAQSPGFALTRARTLPDAVLADAANTYLYTLDRPGDLRWARRHGFGWVATDYPDRAREVAEESVAYR